MKTEPAVLFLFDVQKRIVSDAVKKDTEGDYKTAVKLYCDALAFFVPAITCEYVGATCCVTVSTSAFPTCH